MKRTNDLFARRGIGHILIGLARGHAKRRQAASTAKSLRAISYAVLSLWLSLAQALGLGSICFAKPTLVQAKAVPVAVLSFQDESGAGASDEFCLRLGEHLMKKLYVASNQSVTPKGVRTKAGVEWTQEKLSALGKKMGVQFVVHSGLLALSSGSSGEKVTV